MLIYVVGWKDSSFNQECKFLLFQLMLTIKIICMHKDALVFKDNFSSPVSPIPQMTELAYNQTKP